MVQGKITEADAPTIRLVAIPSGLSVPPPPSSPIFLRQMPFLPQPSQFIMALDRHRFRIMLACIPGGLVARPLRCVLLGRITEPCALVLQMRPAYWPIPAVCGGHIAKPSWNGWTERDGDAVGGAVGWARRTMCCGLGAGRGSFQRTQLNSLTFRSDLSSVNCPRSCLSCCWSKGVEWPANRCYVGLVAVGVQEQAEYILFLPLLFDYEWRFLFPVIISPPEQWSLQ